MVHPTNQEKFFFYDFAAILPCEYVTNRQSIHQMMARQFSAAICCHQQPFAVLPASPIWFQGKKMFVSWEKQVCLCLFPISFYPLFGKHFRHISSMAEYGRNMEENTYILIANQFVIRRLHHHHGKMARKAINQRITRKKICRAYRTDFHCHKLCISSIFHLQGRKSILSAPTKRFVITAL